MGQNPTTCQLIARDYNPGGRIDIQRSIKATEQQWLPGCMERGI